MAALQRGTIVFLSHHNSIRSQMAEAWARRLAPAGVEVYSAGLVPQAIHPLALEVMAELGTPMDGQAHKAPTDLGEGAIDLVVVFDPQHADPRQIFPGSPATVCWPVGEPAAQADRASLRTELIACSRSIEREVRALFSSGYWEAIVRRKKNTENILHALSEGIIAHDLQRRIFFFNRSAEELTGWGMEEVLGRDCHDVFQPRFCGDECGFCDGCGVSPLHKRKYATVLLDRRGVRRELEVRTIPLSDRDGTQIGVVTSLSDLTGLKTLQRRLAAEEQFWGIVGQDHKMQLIYDLIRDLAQSDFPVVITGESGTGKELVARAIHHESGRRDKPFVAINCGALPEGTLESELFGHVRGSFTGAIRDKKGRFELADGGTLFLDEVGELTLAIQVKLLRVLQEAVVEPVGSERSRAVNVRIISATNRTLKDLVRSGAFREDLYYRLAVVPVELPPVRERRNDIPLIARHLLAGIAEKVGRPGVRLSDEAVSVMMSYRWPGNVRELQNAIQFAMVKCRDELILPTHLPPEITRAVPGGQFAPAEVASGQGQAGRRSKLREESVRLALNKAGGNKAKAARMLGVGRATLYNFIRAHDSLASWVVE